MAAVGATTAIIGNRVFVISWVGGQTTSLNYLLATKTCSSKKMTSNSGSMYMMAFFGLLPSGIWHLSETLVADDSPVNTNKLWFDMASKRTGSTGNGMVIGGKAFLCSMSRVAFFGWYNREMNRTNRRLTGSRSRFSCRPIQPLEDFGND